MTWEAWWWVPREGSWEITPVSANVNQREQYENWTEGINAHRPLPVPRPLLWGCTTSLNNTTDWRPSVQAPEPVGEICYSVSGGKGEPFWKLEKRARQIENKSPQLAIQTREKGKRKRRKNTLHEPWDHRWPLQRLFSGVSENVRASESGESALKQATERCTDGLGMGTEALLEK